MKSSVGSHDEEFVFRLLTHIKRLKSESFAGVGLIFYLDLEGLPSIPLGDPVTARPVLPVVGIDEIAKTLVCVSDYGSLWHDGFHMIDIRSKSLTHLSQYLAPQLSGASIRSEGRPNGARQMTALISSSIPGIAYVGVLGVSEEIVVYQCGDVLSGESDIIE